MANVRDVGQYILSKVGQTSTWNLQKLHRLGIRFGRTSLSLTPV
jgi:hypothetical protein